MSNTQDDPRIQDRLSQLDGIIARRNEFLRELFILLHSKPETGSLSLDYLDKDDDDLRAFLQRFDINQDLDRGSIAHLTDEEIVNGLTTPTSQTAAITSEPGTSKPGRSTRSRSKVNDTMAGSSSTSKPPSQSTVDKRRSAQPTTPKQSGILEDSDEDHDELDLIGSAAFSDDKESKSIPFKPQRATPSRAPTTAGTKVQSPNRPSSHPLSVGKEDEEMEVDALVVQLKSEQKMEVDGEGTQEIHVHRPNNSEVLKMDVQFEVDEEKKPSQSALLTISQSPSTPSVVPMQTINPQPLASTSQTEQRPSSPQKQAPGGHISRPAMQIPTPPPVREKIHISALPPSTQPNYQLNIAGDAAEPKPTTTPSGLQPIPNSAYTLPPISILPAEFTRKVKNNRRKRDKERDKEKGEGKVIQDDVLPLGINRWGATMAANPVWKKLSRAQKCLSTRDWNVAITELKFIRVLERIENLKENGRWSLRQPKKQRGVGGLGKTHWDYLLDEMKWMRIDFREERRWKMALAYTLSTAVLEWHVAKTPEERLRLGICVKWRMEKQEEEDIPMGDEDEEMETEAEDDGPVVDVSKKTNDSLLGVDYGSEEEEEPEKDQQSVTDMLDPSNLIEEELQTAADMKLKDEEVEDPSALSLLPPDTQGDQEMTDAVASQAEAELNGLKSNSNNPMLNSKSSSPNGDSEPQPTKPSKSAFGPLREKIIHSGDDELFFNLPETAEGDQKVGVPDLNTLFPDLQPYVLLDVPSPTPPPLEGKKKAEKRSDRDDPNKRAEDTTYTKLYPTGRFMFSKATLLGPLHPVKRFKDGKWLPTEDSQINNELDNVYRTQEELNNELFDGRSNGPSGSNLALQASSLKDKMARKGGSDHTWSASEDAQLKSLIDKYAMNWNLIAECFNASRLTTPADRRTAIDCLERWKERWGSERKPNLADVVATTGDENSTSGSQILTRKRVSSTSGPSPTTQGPLSSSEARKRRRHLLLMETIRKYNRKRQENIQKNAASARKPSTVHETHAQFGKMPKYTPIELSRMKADRDTREAQEHALARRRQEEQARVLLQQQQQSRLVAAGLAAPAPAPAVNGAANTAQSATTLQVNTPPAAPPSTSAPAAPPSVQAAAPSSVTTNGQPSIVNAQQLAQLQQLQAQAAGQRTNMTAAAMAANRARMAAQMARPMSQQTLQAQQTRSVQLPGSQGSGTTANGQTSMPSNAFYNLPPNLTQEQLIMIAIQAQQHQVQQQGQAGNDG